MAFRIGVDIGGTFTDVCVTDDAGRIIAIAKVRTTPDRPDDAVEHGLRVALAEVADAVTDGAVAHATTLITNSIVQRRGANVGLLVTEGYADTLEIARQHRFDMYDLRIERPAALVARAMRREISERILVDGTIYRPFDEEGVRVAAQSLIAAGADAISIVFLHSYANSVHESEAERIVRAAHPSVPVSTSFRVSGQIREYERMVTTTANSYTQPIAADYLTRLESGIGSVIPNSRLTIMTSSGGVVGPATAAAYPIRLVESGPAAGALAAAADCERLGLAGALSFDMGGTTAKACVVRSHQDGRVEPDISPEVEVGRVYRFTRGSGLPLQVPSVELIEIGAGGGSIARVDRVGRVRVGPESAGAVPGPACYPTIDGQTRPDAEPTVTDADLVLGYIGADSFLGGTMALDEPAAREALERRFRMAPTEAAERVRDAVDEDMALAFRRHCAERGYDPAALPLYAFGGAGPAHACGVAVRLGIERIIVPPAAGIGSAIGLLAAPPRVDLARTQIVRVNGSLDWSAIDHLLAAMVAEGFSLLALDTSSDLSSAWVERQTDLRFLGQAHQLTITIPEAALDATRDAASRSVALTSAFEDAYAAIYGGIPPGVGVEAHQWRVTITGERPPAPRVSGRSGDHAPAPLTRTAWFDGAPSEASVWRRETMPRHRTLEGPVLIEDDESTTVVPPGWRVRLFEGDFLEVARTAR
ncbi:MAG: hydantoinase/oxoprolinase family protein [Chloroflexota bacterium]|nr:MAG: hydantoinase/oxoprolinase family protein [Chloroflexota bacterium]